MENCDKTHKKNNIKTTSNRAGLEVIDGWFCGLMFFWIVFQSSHDYRNDPKFSDRYAWANSADPDQTAPRGAVWSGSTLFAILSASFGLITLW